MNLNLYFGKTKDGKRFEIDLIKKNLHTIFLTGSTGSGKSILHYHLYKQLILNNYPSELGFVFMDMTRVDFTGWKGPYLHRPVIVKPKEAIDYLEKISEDPPKNKTVFIHIEEMDMMNYDPEKVERAWKKIHNSKENIYIVFSTSRPGKDVFTSKIKENTGMVIACITASKTDSETIGVPGAENLFIPWEKTISIDGKYIKLLPLSKKELKDAKDFDKFMY